MNGVLRYTQDKLTTSANQAQKPGKNIYKTFACTLFTLTFAAPISSFETPVNRE